MDSRQNVTLTDPAAAFPDDVLWIELKHNLAADPLGLSTTAWLLDASGARKTGSEVTVWDCPGVNLPAVGALDIPGNDSNGDPTRGARGFARYSARRGALEIVQVERVANEGAFELYDDMTPGGSNKYAYSMKADLSDADTSATMIQVSDGVVGDTLAYGRNHSGFTRGARGWYQYHAGSGKNQIIVCQKLAKMIQATAGAPSGSYIAADAIFTVSSCAVLDDGQNPCGTSATITIKNWGLKVCLGQTVTCQKAPAAASFDYFVIDTACPPTGGCT
jgi:hypothetical protein